jgi:type I restriction enzyme M protein
MREMQRKAYQIPGLSNKGREALTSEIQSKSLYGVDAGSAPKIYRIARMNMYLHGDGGSNIFFADSLDKNISKVGKSSVEYEIEIDEVRRLLVRDHTRFNVILSNPPFSMKYSRDDPDQDAIMDQYDLGRLGGTEQKSILSSVMFLERYSELVSEDGTILAIIDESILSGDLYAKIRDYIRSKFIIEAIISLPGDAFRRAAARVKTSVIVLRLKSEGEEQPDVYMERAVRLGIEPKVAKRIGLRREDLEDKKCIEMDRIVNGFKLFRSGDASVAAVSSGRLNDRLDVKYCIGDTGRKSGIWKKQGVDPLPLKRVLSPATGRKVSVSDEDVYQFLRVNYDGEVLDGELISGSDCSYRTLYQVKEWDVLLSNMGVGRGAVGIVPPCHEQKFVSNEYTILCAETHEAAVYYTGVIRTKEILGDVLSTTTGMNRGRVSWAEIAEVLVPKSPKDESRLKELVKGLEDFWRAHQAYLEGRAKCLNGFSSELKLSDEDSHERWLASKPPE